MSLDCTSQAGERVCGEAVTSHIDDHNHAHPLTPIPEVNPT